MKKLVIAALFLSLPASAAEQVFNIALPANDLSYIANVLAKEPYKDVARLISDLQRQVNEQVKQVPTPGSPVTGGIGGPPPERSE